MRELTWKPGQAAELSTLDREPCDGPASILEFSGRRMRLATGLKLKGGVPIRLEWDGQLLLGQVLNTEPGGFWMEIQHMLLDTATVSWRDKGWQSG